jgi:hypothetical protein
MEPSNVFDTEARAREHLTKALNFQRMGMAASAEYELNQARQLDPAIVSDSLYQTFHTQVAEQQALAEGWKLPLRIGAGILIADALTTVILGLLNLAGGHFEFLIWALVRLGLDVYLIINLLRLKDTARRAALWWAGLGLVLGSLSALAAGSWVDLMMQISFSGALLLLLLGRPSKVRAGLAAGLFGLCYFGSLCGAFALSFINALG